MRRNGRSRGMHAWVRLLAIAVACSALAAKDAIALMPMPLVDTVWSWHATTAADGSRSSVASPERYTLQLLSDGTARVRADCNRGTAVYRADDVELRFDRVAMTKRGCPAGSRGSEFVAELARIDRYRFEGVDLIAVRGDATLRFRPLAR